MSGEGPQGSRGEEKQEEEIENAEVVVVEEDDGQQIQNALVVEQEGDEEEEEEEEEGVERGSQRSDEVVSRRGVNSDNPRYRGGGGDEEEEDEEEEEEAEERRDAAALQRESGLVTASEFEYGYFTNAETRCAAFATLFTALFALVIVLAAQLYEFIVLDPPCPEVNTTVDNSTSCVSGEGGVEIATAATSILVSFVIPAIGLYGSIHRLVEVLQVYRVLSVLFGGFSLFGLITNSMDVQRLADSFSSCSVGEACLMTYFLLEGLYIFCYLVLNVIGSSYLIRRIEDLEEKEENYSQDADLANVVRDATVIRVINREIAEDDQVHPQARTVPLRRTGDSSASRPQV